MAKKLEKYGIAGKEFTDSKEAAGYTYTTRTGDLVPTPLVFKDNPFNDLVTSSLCVLDLGCGVGRNAKWIIENTNAHYIGIDPNESMLKFFWDIQPKEWQDRISLHKSFEDIPDGVKFDVVICTFVFQHIGFRPTGNLMNVTDITQEALRFCHQDTVWIMYEHEGEEKWMTRWMEENNVTPAVYIRNYSGIPELTHRGLHHLIVWKVK